MNEEIWAFRTNLKKSQLFTEFAGIAIVGAELGNEIILQDTNAVTQKGYRNTNAKYEKHQQRQEFQPHIWREDKKSIELICYTK